jgi:hypothetical protein
MGSDWKDFRLGDISDVFGLDFIEPMAHMVSGHRLSKSPFYKDPGSVGLRVSPWRKLMIAVYANYQSSPQWKEMREKVLSGAGHRCVHCNERATIAHHKSYDKWASGDEEIFALEAVCRRCHARLHSAAEPMVFVPFFAKRSADASFISDDARESILTGIERSMSIE